MIEFQFYSNPGTIMYISNNLVVAPITYFSRFVDKNKLFICLFVFKKH